MSLFATKPIEQIIAEAEESGEHTFKKALSALDLTMLGIGAIIGTGIFVLTGQAAGKHAGTTRLVDARLELLRPASSRRLQQQLTRLVRHCRSRVSEQWGSAASHSLTVAVFVLHLDHYRENRSLLLTGRSQSAPRGLLTVQSRKPGRSFLTRNRATTAMRS